MSIVRLRKLAGLVCGLGVLAFASPVAADLLRCKGPDGKVVYTDKASVCPGAEPFEPSAVIQTAPNAGRTNPAAPARPIPTPHQRKLSLEAEEAQAEHWRQKKRAKEDELAAISARREEMRPMVGHCNRGGYVLTRDEAGIKRTVSCSALRRDFAALDDREAEARDYLQNGLKEECRREGCLPGWIR